jgi:DNA-directed RNA polymerase specialized sigma subunit
MGFFANQQIDIIEMYFDDGIKEPEIARILEIPEEEVHEVLAAWEAGEFDQDPAEYAEASADADAEYYATHG